MDSAGILQGLPVGVAAQGTSGTVTDARQISTANITLAGSAASYGLLNNSSSAARQLSLGGFTYTINGIIGTNTNLLTIVPGTGGRLIIGTEKNLVINSDNTGGTTISAPIDNNGSTGGIGGTASGVTITSTIPTGTPGTVTLSGANTYTGHTYINNATLAIGNNSALGTTASGTTIIGSPLGNTTGTTLDLGSTALTLSEAIHINGNQLGRARIFNGAAVNHVLNGNIDVTSDTGFAQIWNNNNSGSITVNGDITGTLTNGAAFLLRGTSTSTSSQILGSVNLTGGNLFKVDTGTWLIGAAGETYSWVDTQVAHGTLRMGAANVLPSTGQLIMGQNATSNTPTLDLNGFDQTVAGMVDLTNTSAKTITSSTGTPTLTVGNAGDYSYGSNGGVLTGSLALTKTGAGTQTLSGTNTYTGATQVNQGTLIINGSTSSTSLVTVGVNGTLGGTGTVGGHTTISGTHNPGNSPGIQTFGGNLSYVDGGIPDPVVNWELTANTSTNLANPNALFDQIIVGGDLDFTNLTTINLVFNTSGNVLWGDSFWNTDQSWLLYDVAGTTGNFGNLSLATINWLDSGSNPFNTARPGSGFSLSPNGNDIFLNYTAVPEPRAALLGGFGLLMLLRRRRR